MRTILYLAIVALIATSSCSSSDSSSDSGSELPADVAQVVEDYINAATAQDADAWRETITDSFINRRGQYVSGAQKRVEDASYTETADPYAKRIEFYPALEYEQVGDFLVTGDGPWFVTVRQRFIERSEPDDIWFEGNATFVVVERDGDMKVDAEYWAGSVGFLED
jgi:hypothetical protein